MFKDPHIFISAKTLFIDVYARALPTGGTRASGVSRERAENRRFGGRQFQCPGSSDCFVKAGFIAVAQLICLSICSGFKESPKVIYSISTPRRVFDKALLKPPD